MENKKNFLSVIMDDYSEPSFCSFQKTYFGTWEELDSFISVYRESRLSRLAQEREGAEKGLKDFYNDVGEACHRQRSGRSCATGESTRTGRRDVPLTDDGQIDWPQVRAGYAALGEKLGSVLVQMEDDTGYYDGAWRRYCNGDEAAVVFAAQAQWKFVNEVEVLGSVEFEGGPGSQKLANTWDFPYVLSWNSIQLQLRWTITGETRIQADGEQVKRPLFSRVLKVELEGPAIGDESGTNSRFPAMAWGIHGLLVMNEPEERGGLLGEAGIPVAESGTARSGSLATRIWIPERLFGSKEELVGDYEEFSSKLAGGKLNLSSPDADVDLTCLLKEIVGNG